MKYYTSVCKERILPEIVKPTYINDLCLLHRLLKRPNKAFPKRLLRYDIFLTRYLFKQSKTEVWARRLCEAYISVGNKKQVIRWFT